ncbi:MAG: DUF72 domain-containing protein, partial [Chitinivibrionales bacterium]|nr:DUF72 domain-containing protein [Chitinivibrionales bacterium]
MKNILVGTSGYSYKDWVGPVYPPGTATKDYLRLYAERFSMTELNFCYYKQPDPRTLERMAHGTPDHFRFAVKAHKSLTHERSDDFVRDAVTFKRGIAPLIETSKLCAVLVQFPYSFHYTPRNRMYLKNLCDEFAGIPTAVEFRTGEWQRDSVYTGLRNIGVSFVNVDEPSLPGLPVPTAQVTSYLAYVRFHGRNEENWWEGDNVSRYDYLYTEEQLSEWVPRIETMGEE